MRSALDQPIRRVVVALLAAALQLDAGWLCICRAVVARDPVAIADLTGGAGFAHPELGDGVALARRAVRALGVGRPESKRARLTWVRPISLVATNFLRSQGDC